MPIKSPQELFTYELSCTYGSEQIMLKGMEQMRQMAQSDRVRQLLDRHMQETQQQIRTLEQCFQEVGTQPRVERTRTPECLIQDFQALSQQIEDPRLIDVVILTTWAKGEHLEMATYRTLVGGAQMMGQTRVADLLSRILADEEKEAKEVEQVVRDIGQQMLGGQQPGRQPYGYSQP